ncbi:MAG: nucleotidyltransferase substrate binding protein [Candidatus Dependentiae bacterium]
MNCVKQQYLIAEKCLTRFSNSINLYLQQDFGELKDLYRDSMIKQFALNVIVFCRFLRDYIEAIHGIPFTFVSSGQILRVALQTNTITESEFELLSQMIKDRNLTSHTYNEKLAQTLVDHFDNYHKTLKIIIDRLNIR